jgi:hypothetical protein
LHFFFCVISSTHAFPLLLCLSTQPWYLSFPSHLFIRGCGSYDLYPICLAEDLLPTAQPAFWSVSSSLSFPICIPERKKIPRAVNNTKQMSQEISFLHSTQVFDDVIQTTKPLNKKKKKMRKTSEHINTRKDKFDKYTDR